VNFRTGKHFRKSVEKLQILDKIKQKLSGYFIHEDLSAMGYATTNGSTTNERYNEKSLSIKAGCYSEGGL
jgi:hypothetical protein